MENSIESIFDWIRNRHFGKYRGKVTDNNDSTNKGRIEVTVPKVLNDLKVWALPCLPYTGKNSGHYMIPEPGAGVWVEFEGGDPSQAIWTGGFWADDELPTDQNSSTVKPALRMMRSEKGLMVSMDDEQEIISISDADAGNIITVEKNEGKIKIAANTKVVVEAPSIELVENALHPVVFGDELLQYLNTLVFALQSHQHVVQVGPAPVPSAPTVTIFNPPPASILSTKVTAG